MRLVGKAVIQDGAIWKRHHRREILHDLFFLPLRSACYLYSPSIPDPLVQGIRPLKALKDHAASIDGTIGDHIH